MAWAGVWGRVTAFFHMFVASEGVFLFYHGKLFSLMGSGMVAGAGGWGRGRGMVAGAGGGGHVPEFFHMFVASEGVFSLYLENLARLL